MVTGEATCDDALEAEDSVLRVLYRERRRMAEGSRNLPEILGSLQAQNRGTKTISQSSGLRMYIHTDIHRHTS